jgi:hypothetical protein
MSFVDPKFQNSPFLSINITIKTWNVLGINKDNLFGCFFFFFLLFSFRVLFIYLCVCVCVQVCFILFFSSYGLRVIHTLFFSSSSLCFQGNTYGPLFSHFPMLDVREDSHPFSSFSGRKVGGEKNSKQLVFALFIHIAYYTQNLI